MPRNKTRAISLAQARAQFVHRYTMEHIPAWARKPCEGNGKYYAPQYASDAEWYENTTFPGEGDIHGNAGHCESSGQTWPLGQWLDTPYKKV
jgi:hypothetical protein